MAHRKDNPLVSIIIPTYNMGQWIGESIDSALAQTYPNCEIIVVDDGSTDGTGDLLRERYGDKIRYIYQENRGRGAARNAGFAVSRGEYIQFLDADDILCPNKTRAHVEFLNQNPQYAVVYGAAQLFVDGDRSHTWEYPAARYFRSGNLLATMIQHGGLLQPFPALTRREWIEKTGGFDEDMVRCEDFDFWLRIAHQGAEFAYLPGEPVGFYRKFVSPGSDERNNPAFISIGPGDAVAHAEGVLYSLNKLGKELTRQEFQTLRLASAIAEARFSYARALLKKKRRKEGISNLLLSLRACNFAIRVQIILYLLLAPWLPYPHVEQTVQAIITLQHKLRGCAKTPPLIKSRVFLPLKYRFSDYLYAVNCFLIGLSQQHTCPYCQTPDTRLVRARYFFIQLRYCPNCHLRFRFPKEISEQATNFYQKHYRSGMTTVLPSDSELQALLNAEFRGTEKDMASKIEVLTTFLPDGNVLDFGSSWGYGSWQLKNAGLNVVGFEIGKERANYATEKLGIETISDRGQLAQRVGSFDGIFTSHVLEHLPDATDIFEEFNRLLRPNGVLVSFTPNGDPAYEKHVGRQQFDNIAWGKVHPLCFSFSFMHLALEQAGFEIVFTGLLLSPEMMIVARKKSF